MEKGRIGLNAGKVWHALNEVNEISTQELSRKLSLSIEDLALAIGWLARENNIYITRKNGLLYVSNGIKSNMGSPDKPGGLSIQL
ncbi:winged helix-turn-helix domain-containing protein, partial [Parabacteroides sp. AF19-14]|uniref:winged helix-turn-helix domain-containing protein n=1 Tax=Parabacteroides sp. AF19-14 TaxID=2293114 RepID=UPI000F00027E